ncbi:MAG: hypothetical protein AAFY73_09535 [Pseudomonadota bacterium]
MQETKCDAALEQGLLAPTPFDVTVARCIELAEQSDKDAAAISWFIDVNGDLMIELPKAEGPTAPELFDEAPSIAPDLVPGQTLTSQLSTLATTEVAS